MSERLEWLKAPSQPKPSPRRPESTAEAVRPCPVCGWPNPSSATECARCGQAMTLKTDLASTLAELGVTPLPRIVETETDLRARLRAMTLDEPAVYDLRLRAESLRLSTGFDSLICLDDISIDHHAYQLEAALRALRDIRGRALLADEVGLGKTIETGIVMKELIERGLAQSVLILVPASLTMQWHEEMRHKFHEEFTVVRRPRDLELPDGQTRIRWIVSLSRAKRARYAQALLAREYDLLIVDEAHKLKNRRTKVHRFVNQIRKRYVLLLTATPVHNDLMELYGLINILRPGHLGTVRAFRRNFVARREPEQPTVRRRARRTVVSSKGWGYLGRSKEWRDEHWASDSRSWLKKYWRRSHDFERLATLPLSGRREKARQEIIDLIQQGYEVFDYELLETSNPLRRGRYEFVARLRLSEKAREARRRERAERPHTRQRNVTPRNAPALRRLLAEVMIRNRRSKVGVRLPPRRAAVYHLQLTPPERALYDGVTAYIRDELAGRPHARHLRLTLMMLQKELCSSPQAVAATLAKMLANPRQTDEARLQLGSFLDLAHGIVRGRKTEAVLKLLDRFPDQVVIFTEFLPTLRVLEAALKAHGHEVAVFHGGLDAYAKEDAIRAFRKGARALISTESGAEGRNLQFCRVLINYDLPWNPMRIEQRIGRLHRLGQEQEVLVFTLAAENTIEAYILDLLANKIRMFELVIGELDLILGAMDDPRSFETFIRDAWLESYSEADLQRRIARMEALLAAARRSYEEVTTLSDELADILATD
jgi:SNF2 family DNA or RNA helicase